MSSWGGQAKSNVFKIKDKEEYVKFCERWNCSVLEDEYEGDKNYRYLIFKNGILYYLDMDAHQGGPTAEDFLEDLANQLADNSVAIIYEIGGEGWRFFTGEGVAINAKKERRRIWIGDINKQAKELGEVLYNI